MNLKRIIKTLIPPPVWRLPVIFLLGVIGGMGLFIIKISNAPSYFSDEPATCVNCHVMSSEFATWQKSSHVKVATCNDCHVPQDNLLRKLYFKSMDGLRHSTIFTMRWDPQVITIKDAGLSVVQENCIRCHSKLIDESSLIESSFDHIKKDNGKFCWQCHREVPHGRVHSLSSAPDARTPRLSPVLPEWINNEIKK